MVRLCRKFFAIFSFFACCNFNAYALEGELKKGHDECLKISRGNADLIKSELLDKLTLKAGDTIRYVSFDDKLENSLSNKADESEPVELVVDALGYIAIPKVGYLNVNDLSFNELEDKITDSLRSVYLNPSISLLPVVTSPLRVTISGQVQKPGYYFASYFETENVVNINEQPARTLKSILVLSGGLLNSANFKNIIVRRDDSCYKINMIELTNLDSRYDFSLKNGDVIVVTPGRILPEKNKEYLKIGRSEFSSKKQKVYVYGQVNNPGLVEVDWLNNPQAIIAEAGGFIKGASKYVYIAYKDSLSEKYNVVRVNASIRAKTFLNTKFKPLTNESIIFVSNSKFTTAIELLNNVSIPFFTLNNITRIVSGD